MPIYELECQKCGKVEEKLFTRIVHFLTPAEVKKRERERKARHKRESPGYDVIDTTPLTAPNELMPKCSQCRGPQLLLPSKVNMQPDKYWSGQVVHGKYVTSKKQIDRDIEPVTRDRLEWVRKQKRKRVKEHAEKSAKNLRDYLTRQLSDVTIEPDGNSVKERMKYERARNRNYSGSTD